MNPEDITRTECEIVARHFMIAAVFADAPEGTRPRITKQSLKAAETLAYAFVQRIGYGVFRATLQAYKDAGLHPDCNGSPCAAFGHDLYLTLAGHGVGFWDREALDEKPGPFCGGDSLGIYLTRHCGATAPKELHSLEFYRGWVYFNGN